jgi:Xaa-Pro aminopeptidase
MKPSFFSGNRRRLSEGLKPRSFLVLTAFARVQGDNDGAAPFHQESNFWYLTGITEPDWKLVIDLDSAQEFLIAPHVNFVHQMFDGSLTPQDAKKVSGVAKILTKREGAQLLKDLLGKKKQVYTVLPQDLRLFGIVPNPALRRLQTQLKSLTVTDVRLDIARLRAIKQPEEIATMQKSIDITLDALEELLPQLKNLQYEYEVDALLTSHFRKNAAVHGFEPIVAAGKNTCVLHHPLPKDPLKQNDWLLLDIGAKVDGYSADITRTLPIGNPSPRHIEFYEAVERMHNYAFSMLKDGVPAKEYMEKAYQNVGEELKKLGLITHIKMDYTSVFKYMPHAVSHGLGVDVHDPLGRPETLKANMTLTVEVGAYNPAEGIGVRLEDDILITKDGAINMSKRVPITLERLRKMIY